MERIGEEQATVDLGLVAGDVAGSGVSVEATMGGDPVISGAQSVEVLRALPAEAYNRYEQDDGPEPYCRHRQAVLAVYSADADGRLFDPGIEQSLAAPESAQTSMFAGVDEEFTVGENALARFDFDRLCAIVVVGFYREDATARGESYAKVYLAP